MNIDRLSLIRQYLYNHGTASVHQLSDFTGASTATLRRDLASLEAEGTIYRSHGGASLTRRSSVEVSFSVRETERLGQKRAIADTAYSLIRPNATIFLDSGTTVLQLARRLRLDPMPVSVFTNGLVVAQELLAVPQLLVTLLGGKLRADNASIVGPFAEGMIDKLYFDQLFIGAGAVSSNGTISSIDIAEASLNSRMLSRSAECIMLVDSRKFGEPATYEVGKVAAGTTIVSDESLRPETRSQLEDAGYRLLLAPYYSSEVGNTAA